MNGLSKLFAPDSKLMHYLGILYDLIILNLLFVLCCLPVFTIGAAQTGLYTGLREIMDRDSGNTPRKSFFKGFKNGFGKITVFWSICAFLIALLGGCVLALYNLANEKFRTGSEMLAPLIFSLVGIALLLMVSAQASLFHSKFDCTLKQLFGNTLIMVISYPGRSILIGAMAFALPIITLIDFYILLFGFPIWLSLFFSFTFLFNSLLMKKPYAKIENKMNEENGKETTEERK